MSESLAGLLARLGIEAFERPGWLLALLPLAALALALRSRPAALPWPSLPEALCAGARRFDGVRVAGLALRAGALVALALVLAGPVGVHRAPPEPGHGLDLVLVVDASGSMRAQDARVDGEWRTRLDLAREVVARFALQRAARGDRVALVAFGETAFTACPLTSDGAPLGTALARLEAGIAGEATALGDALALAVKRALGAERPASETPRGTRSGPVAGRVAVLLTDGRNNSGRIPVELATALAANLGVRVHTVAIGSSGEEVPMAAREGVADRGLQFERHDVDAAALASIARATGGRFFAARRSGDLEAVYAEIDALERVSRPLPSRVRHAPRPEPLLALAGGCLLLELATVRVARRRLP